MNNEWRDIGRAPKFFVFDWKLSIFILLIFFNIFKAWVYMLTFSALAFFYYLNYKGFSLNNFQRYLMAGLSGKIAAGKPFWFRRK